MDTILRRIIWVIILIPAAYLALIWNHVPQTVPIHFDINGNVDSYTNRNNFLFLMIALTVVNMIVYLIVKNIYRIDPKKYAAQNKDRMQRIGFYVATYLSAIWIMLIYEIAHNDVSMTMKFVFVAMGLLFALLGNNMYNIQPNYFAGIRLPWTLENENNWKKTHRLAGRLWFFGGLFFAITSFLLGSKSAGYFGIIILSILIIIPVFYSYNLYKNQTKKTQI
jgi:uncharacterized membrane protein